MCPSYGVPGGETALLLVPLPVLTKTIAFVLPGGRAAASAMSPAARVTASRKLAGPHGAGTACTPGFVPAFAAGGVETHWFVLTVNETG